MKIQTLFNNIYGVNVNTGLTQELATVQFVDNNLLDVRTILAAVSEDIGSLEGGLNTTNTNLTNLAGEVGINTSAISTLNTNLTATNLALDTLTGDVRTVESNVSSLQAALPGKLDATATAVTASKLATIRTISTSGDATVSISFDGSANASGVLTLANTGVVAGTYNDSAIAVRPFTVDAKGRITQIGAAVNITPSFASLTGKPTTLVGYGIIDAISVNDTLDGGTF